MEYILNRDVTQDECPWLDKDFKKGEKVYSYGGATYGCISNDGTACCLIEGEDPFFELPENALTNP
jgi:hypothetical protein